MSATIETSKVALAGAAGVGGVAQDVAGHRRHVLDAARRVDLGAYLVRLGRARLVQNGELDEVAGEAVVAGRGELACPGEHALEPTRELDPCPGLLGTRRGEQVVGLTVVPAAVAAPDVAHDELRMVVHRLQVRQIAQMLGHLDLVEHAVEGDALVHQRQRLGLERVEQLGGVGERPLHPIGAEDRQAVARQHHLGTAGRHLAQRHRPVAGEALDLLRIAGIRDRPDEQVAGVEHGELRHPRPRRVVGLATGVMQLERQVATRERQVVRVGDVGVAVGVGPCEVVDRQRELALVDRCVPAERALVAAEVVGEVLVGVDRRGRPPLLGRLGLEAPGPEDVVDVVMAVDGGGQRIVGAPRAHDVVEVVAVELAAGVEHHEAVRGVDRVHGRDRDERQDAGCDLLGCPPECRPHRVLVADEIALAVPVPLGHVPNSAGLDRVTHAWGSYAWVMSCSVCGRHP